MPNSTAKLSPRPLSHRPAVQGPPPLPEYPGGKWVAGLLIAYVVFVLLADTLATLHVKVPFDWAGYFLWRPRNLAPFLSSVLPEGFFTRTVAPLLASPKLGNIDFFKATFWFLVPVLLSLPFMDWEAWQPFRWKRRDWLLLGFAFVGGTVAVLLIPYLPGVRDLYQPSPMHPTLNQKLTALLMYNLWCLCWLPGWEFLHRYVLLAALGKFFPRGGWGWLIVPVCIATSEMAYHLVKPWPETLAMFGFGLAASLWAYSRSNFLLPLIAHWFIEVALVVFLVVNS